MMYKTFAWPVHQNNESYKFKSNLYVLSSTIDIEDHLENENLSDIKQVCMLDKRLPDKGQLIKLVFQMPDRIVVLTLHDSDLQIFCQKPTEMLAEVNMIQAN